MKNQKVALVILDGWGHAKDPKRSAIDMANTPFVDSLYKNHPNAELVTFGQEVGLPAGQMGNSEVGHLNIGAGRVVYQELARINKAIEDGSLQSDKKLLAAIEYAEKNSKKIHLLGLVSDGGVHSHIEHLKAISTSFREKTNQSVFIHAFLDGRDTDPQNGIKYLQDLQAYTQENVKLGSIIGRYYAMDRDKRWERIKLAYDLLVHGKGETCQDPLTSLNNKYAAGITDEFIPPIVVDSHATIEEGDVVFFYNFRTDRPRQLSEVLTQKDFPDHEMKRLDLRYITMTSYDESFKNIEVIFEKDKLVNTLGQVIESAELSQVRAAETEKYPHVTFFFSGGREEAYRNEQRILVPSPKVATYDLKPSMSANELTEQVIETVQKNSPDFICLNYANTDMVGHTGIVEAAIEAAEVVDNCLARLVKVGLQEDYIFVIIADHGNSDVIMNEDGSMHTAHTTNLVPIFIVSNGKQFDTIQSGKLGDVAPTILSIMGVNIPSEMTGSVLI